MKEVIRYKCEFCNRTFKSATQASAHEAHCLVAKGDMYRLLKLVKSGDIESAKIYAREECRSCKYSVFMGKDCPGRTVDEMPCVSASPAMEGKIS